MSRTCSICTHPRREEIDKAIVAGVPFRKIAQDFGVSRSSVDRHQKNGHIPEELAKATKAKEVAQADTLLAQVTKLKERANKILDTAEKEGTREACMALREVRSIIELLAKVQGDLPDGPTVNITIIENQYNEFKTAIVGVMCPDCQRRLAEYLRAQLAE